MSGINDLISEFMVTANALPYDEKLGAFRLVRSEIEREIGAMKRRLAEQLDRLNSVLAPADLLTVCEKATPARKKFTNPNDPTQTWNGVGRRPEWFVEAINAGVAPEQLEIPT